MGISAHGQGVTAIVAVDDTDDLTKSTSTGKVADLVAAACTRELGATLVLGVSRHQLLLDESVPYTSHNSAMAMQLELPRAEGASAREQMMEEIRELAVAVIRQEAVASADPGLCVALLPTGARESIGSQPVGSAACRRELESLMRFGLDATREYCSKQRAYALAESIPWLSLTEHGGTGQGVVGALAGVGLRLTGNNGRFRGGMDLAALLSGSPGASQVQDGSAGGAGGGSGSGAGGGAGIGSGSGSGAGRGADRGAGEGAGRRAGNADGAERSRAGADVLIRTPEQNTPTSPTAAASRFDRIIEGSELCSVASARERLERMLNGPVRILDERGADLPATLLLRADGNVKALLRDGAATIVAQVREGIAEPLSKQGIDAIESKAGIAGKPACPYFSADNDPEELLASLSSSELAALPLAFTEQLLLCADCLFRRWTSNGLSCSHLQ